MVEKASQLRRLAASLRAEPGRDVHDVPTEPDDSIDKKSAEHLLVEGIGLLAEYQDRLAAEGVQAVLLVLQGMDAAGKDGTIKHVMSGVNPQGVEVHSFKQPSAEELDHDFLWRCQRALPARGRIGIFNRSHYEEVLVVRVHPDFLEGQHLPGEAKGEHLWQRRYREINDWERHLTENGTRVVKVMLHVSRSEQRERFLSRIDDPEKNWKFRAGDVRERRLWDEYQTAYSEMLGHTSTEWAPWHVVPADKKWFARAATAAILVDALIDMDPHYPVLSDEERAAMAEAKAELDADT